MHALESNATPAVIAPAFPYSAEMGALPNETHMNRGSGRTWWHTPAVASSVACGIGVLIFMVSASAFGADISFMLRKLI